jgi:leucyl aminopeptidase
MSPIHFSPKADLKNSIEVFIYHKDEGLDPYKSFLTSEEQSFIDACMQRSQITQKDKDFLSITFPPNRASNSILLINIHEKWHKNAPIDRLFLEELGAKIYKKAACEEATSLIIYPHGLEKITTMESSVINAWIASGISLYRWNFEQYKTKKKTPSSIVDVQIITPNPQQCQEIFHRCHAICEGNSLTRTVVSEPPNVLYPASMAGMAEELASIGIQVTVLDQKKLKELGCGALLGVAQGSINDPFLVTLEWKGAKDPKAAPIAVVGKGVTFDSGGISIKPSTNMEDMKYDMAGAGVVLGLMKSIAMEKVEKNVVGVLGLVENMPSGSAQRPSDVVHSMSGQTIEVVNTDAEGRLVLADALWYVQEQFNPNCIIDLATLTGAIVVALGHEYAGLFSNNDELVHQLRMAGVQTGERLWNLPLADAYDKDINSDIADMKNVGSGRGAGSITAAHFLKRFIKGSTPWAHLDIAGVAWEKKGTALTQKGATGFGVRLLEQFIRDFTLPTS